MIFIIGGAYQGKLDYAVEKYNLKDTDVFECGEAVSVDDIPYGACGTDCGTDDVDVAAEGRMNGTEGLPAIDFSKECIYKIQEFTHACVKCGVDPLDYFLDHEAEWQDSILICEDIFCGVVPLGADMREWRQATGRLCKYLSGQAESVVRIFCGLEQRLK